jgi:nitroreductase
MDLKQLIINNRSYRRFYPAPRPSRAQLEAWVGLARLAASGGNRQPLRYWLVDSPAACDAVFPHTRWAGLLKGWRPAPAETPTAYVLVLAAAGGATPQADAGIATQTLLLAAAEQGFGGCMLGSIDRPAIQRALNIPEAFDLLYAVALGKPAETCLLEEAAGGNIAYYRTPDGLHHVPKLSIETLILNPAEHA